MATGLATGVLHMPHGRLQTPTTLADVANSGLLQEILTSAELPVRELASLAQASKIFADVVASPALQETLIVRSGELNLRALTTLGGLHFCRGVRNLQFLDMQQPVGTILPRVLMSADKLTSLTLRNCHVRPSQLAKALRWQTQNFRSLTWQEDYVWLDIEASQFLNRVMLTCPELTELKVQLQHGLDWTPGAIETVAQGWSNLTTLAYVSVRGLANGGLEILQRSKKLKKLGVTRVTGDVAAKLKEAARKLEEKRGYKNQVWGVEEIEVLWECETSAENVKAVNDTVEAMKMVCPNLKSIKVVNKCKADPTVEGS